MSEIHTQVEVEIVHYDKDGNVKSIENKTGILVPNKED
jgi:hypothetical protein